MPVGLGVGKVFTFAGKPLNGSVSAFYNLVRPTGAPEWTLRVQIAALFPAAPGEGESPIEGLEPVVSQGSSPRSLR